MKYVEIFQIKNIEDCDYAFRGWRESMQQKFNIVDYKLVYREAVDNKPDNEICEELFERFNLSDSYYRQSVNYTGRSLSTSDIIRVDDMEKSKPKFYYCDSFGFKDITKFIK